MEKNPVRFLLHDSGTDSDECVIIFATEANLQELARSVKWNMNGNFAMAPHISMQLYVIQGNVSGCFTIGICTSTKKNSTQL